jgi:hypothetical protein
VRSTEGLLELLPDAEQLRAKTEDVYETFRREGQGPAWVKFATLIAPDFDPADMPTTQGPPTPWRRAAVRPGTLPPARPAAGAGSLLSAFLSGYQRVATLPPDPERSIHRSDVLLGLTHQSDGPRSGVAAQ